MAPEATKAVGRQCPSGRLRRNPPAGAQDIAGYRQLVGGRADILCGVVENEVFEMHQLTVYPQ
ncbi:hypothetical protein GHK61_26615 [Sinorhizobium meliloti]|nr:hypothetical protein CDO25_19170 [Sinorhizobium meliloti]MQX59906.1 hypothetical protein [Sinorhizobium meliloti]